MKRFKNGLSIGFKWVHSNGESSKTSAVLASYHNPRSITWRWALYWGKPYKGTFKFFTKHLYPSGYGSRTITLPFIGIFILSTQESMFRT